MSKTMKHFKEKPNLLLSSSFIDFMLVSKNHDHKHHLKKLLGAKVSLFSTRCSIRKADYGNEVYDLALQRLKIKVLECGHRGAFAEFDCMRAIVENGNEHCYYIATGKEDHVADFQLYENVPVILSEGACIFLKEVSDHQERLAAEGLQGNRMHGRRDAGIGDHRNGGRAQ